MLEIRDIHTTEQIIWSRSLRLLWKVMFPEPAWQKPQ